MRSVFIALVVFFSGAANALTIDFEEVGGGILGSPLYSQGFQFQSRVGFSTDTVSDPGNTFLIAIGDPDPMSITRVDEKLFALNSLDIFYASGFGDGLDVLITGYDSENQIIAQKTEFYGGSDGLRNLSFDSIWTNIDRLTMTASKTGDWNYLTIDNINVNVVPIPAAAWLFGSALAGLGWLRRKQAA